MGNFEHIYNVSELCVAAHREPKCGVGELRCFGCAFLWFDLCRCKGVEKRVFLCVVESVVI